MREIITNVRSVTYVYKIGAAFCASENLHRRIHAKPLHNHGIVSVHFNHFWWEFVTN